ncbi:MAG: hypothetical protein ACJASY_002295 [Halioglobus sp.]|jgi:hypothetical protein
MCSPRYIKVGRTAAFVLLCLFGAASIADDAAEIAPTQEVAATELPVEVAESVSAAPLVGRQSPEPIPYKSNDIDLADTFTESILYLGILFTIAAVTIFLFKRRMVSGGSLPEKLGSHIRVVDRKALSTKTTVHLLEVDGRGVLLSESPHGVSVIELGVAQRAASASNELMPVQNT